MESKLSDENKITKERKEYETNWAMYPYWADD
jgi:hypothetical protein